LKIRSILMISSIILLNFIDLFLTVFCIKHFNFQEANPIAKKYMEYGIIYLTTFKLCTMSIGMMSIVILSHLNYKFLPILLWTLFFIFSCLVLYWSLYLKELVI